MDDKLRADAEKAFPGMDQVFYNYNTRRLSMDFTGERLSSLMYGDVAREVKAIWIADYMERNREKFYHKIIAGALAGNDANEPF